ncbi:NAD(P)H nitroreductase [Alkalibaculum sp. M08DMB]|uniref:NAD(P)H nitroreductase n=1 Tax=Alkalibaculum sporogenes TaxID=2655001 RepID=A0A6A7K9C3_9FIRM|nr:nitroreductase family protein [Alkalibaculum sporogenes]MPW26078.1 NAD(P)H nitroreductase [Alkalibaculum sporogenes]
MINEFKKRRSIRKYKKIPIEQEKIDSIVQNALISPSSRNIRPWEFIIITEGSVLIDLSQSRQHGSTFVKDAPLVMVIVSDQNKSDMWIEDSSIAAFTIQLSAYSIGLGSCWIQVRDRMRSDNESSENYIKEILNIPKHYNVECMVSLGYSDEDKEEYTKNDMEFSKVHYNEYTKQ